MNGFLRTYFSTVCGAILVTIGASAAAEETRQLSTNPAIADVATTSAMPKPGTVIGSSNANGFGWILTPSMVSIVRSGASLKVASYRKETLPKAIVAATSLYARNVRMTPSRALENYVAGLPFSEIDPADPAAAARHMLNYEAANSVDDMDIVGIECDAGTIDRERGSVAVDRHFVLRDYFRLSFVGRVYADPKPHLDPNPEAVRYKDAMRGLLEPFDLKGTGIFSRGYLADNKPIDTWLFVGTTRRVRRISPAQRSQAVLGLDIDLDSFGGFAALVSSFDWKLLGEQTLLSPFHGNGSPVRWSAAPADFLPDGGWEPRPVWVVEGRPVLAGYGYSKRVIYLDRETYRIVASDLYDRAGELWKTWINALLFEGVPDGGSYIGATSAVDVRSGRVTYCSIPGGRSGIGARYVNEGGDSCEARFEPPPVIVPSDPCIQRRRP